jgi:cysteine-rich repeat protein
MRGSGAAILTTIVLVAANSSCFETTTNLFVQSGVRCMAGQTCAVNQDRCIDIGGCGDNIVDPSKDEVCDDGNIRDGDNCSADCKSNETCGNGIEDVIDPLNPKESCDDGNTTPGDGCSPECVEEKCGDSFYDPASEACDTGGDTQACNGSGRCTIPSCGDAYTNPNFKPFFKPDDGTLPEECDNGGLDTPDCNGEGPVGPGSCRIPICGDSYTNTAFTPPGASSPEECDTGIDSQSCNGNGNGISNNLSHQCHEPECGDGYTNQSFTPPGEDATPEECDTGGNSQECNGNDNDNDQKNGLANCAIPKCGDGYKNASFQPPGSTKFEDCDTGADSPTCNGANLADGNNADSQCQVARCGDRYVNRAFTPPGASGTERCDEGVDTQDCNGNGGIGSCRVPICGDRYTNRSFTPPDAIDPEECDDGSADTVDCNGNNGGNNGIGSCRNSTCGDGYMNEADGEDCDRGNLTANIPPVPCSEGKVCSNGCKCTGT